LTKYAKYDIIKISIKECKIFMKEIIIDGNNFSTLEEFYCETDKLLTKNLSWKTGHNLNSFNDLLRGGFGIHEYKEKLNIKWIHADKSRRDFGYPATADYFRNNLKKCHAGNEKFIMEKIRNAENHKGKTLFDIITDIIQDSENSGHSCTLELIQD